MAARGTTSKLKPAGAGAVMAARRSPLAALDYFPTPPWATRALMAHVLPPEIASSSVWEPACGGGHMCEVLREGFGRVYASDVHDHETGYPMGSFVGEGLDIAHCPFVPDWIITNPPFNLALEFALRARAEARRGVALLVRTAWLESEGRFTALFGKFPPAQVALFVERVPMIEGRWDPDASTATSYAWVIWDRCAAGPTRLTWIPPGRKTALTKPGDVGRFAAATGNGQPAAGFEGATQHEA